MGEVAGTSEETVARRGRDGGRVWAWVEECRQGICIFSVNYSWIFLLSVGGEGGWRRGWPRQHQGDTNMHSQP